MTDEEKYVCDECHGTGRLEDNDDDERQTLPCDECDGVGITAVDCPGCGREAVPIHETVFVAAIPQTYCESCGDRELERIAVRRAR